MVLVKTSTAIAAVDVRPVPIVSVPVNNGATDAVISHLSRANPFLLKIGRFTPIAVPEQTEAVIGSIVGAEVIVTIMVKLAPT